MTAAKKWVSVHQVTADFISRSKRKIVQPVHEVKVGQKWRARDSRSRGPNKEYALIEIVEIRGKLIVARDGDDKIRKIEHAKFRPVWDGWDLVSDVI